MLTRGALHVGALLTCAALALTVSGCASMHYDRIQLGMRPSQYEVLLPAGSVRRIPGASCYLSQEPDGALDAIIVLTNDIRLVGAKFHARRIGPPYRLPSEPAYTLVAAVQPALMNAAEAGPLDILRLIGLSIGELLGGPEILQARELVAPGLRRVMEAQPGLEVDPLPNTTQDKVDRIAPPGGQSSCSRAEDGNVYIEYRSPVDPASP